MQRQCSNRSTIAACPLPSRSSPMANASMDKPMFLMGPNSEGVSRVAAHSADPKKFFKKSAASRKQRLMRGVSSTDITDIRLPNQASISHLCLT